MRFFLLHIEPCRLQRPVVVSLRAAVAAVAAVSSVLGAERVIHVEELWEALAETSEVTETWDFNKYEWNIS